MKKLLILLIFIFIYCAFLTYPAYSSDNKPTGEDEIQKKSTLFEEPIFGPWKTSYPYPFNPTADPYQKTNPTVSTGYYFVDNRDVVVNDYRLWRPVSNILDTNFESNLWRRVLSGPHQQPASYWPHEGGYAFFRSWKTKNGTPISGSWFDYIDGKPNDVDSTDDAFAGPMPIGFDFYFNGVRYDSFYVSSNGIVALTNRRYFYNSFGVRTPPSGGQHCYDNMSMDWFVGPGGATPAGYPDRVTSRSITICDGEDGTLDMNDDDFGYNIAVYEWGNSHSGPSPVANGTILQRGGSLHLLNTKLPVIAPFFGDLHLSQYNSESKKTEDWGKVYYKKSISGDSLTIYFVNAVLKGAVVTPSGTYYVSPNHRPTDGADAYLGANAQICLTRKDSTITITYEKFQGILSSGFYIEWRSDFLFRWNTTCGVRGFARHSNFNSKDPTAPVPALCTGNPYYPWTNEYEQTTYYFDKYRNTQEDIGFPEASVAVKFKQWKNVLRVIGIKYMLRQELPETDPAYTNLFQVQLSANKVLDKELLAGHKQLGALQPVALIQNLTNDIQGPNGINYQEQDVEFRARFMIENQATLKTIYNRSVPVNHNCLSLPDPDTNNLCMGIPNVKVRYVHVTNFNTLATTLNPYPGPSNLHGIPPYGYVEVFFPLFIPNPSFENHIGRMHARIIGETYNHDLDFPRYDDEWPFDDTTSSRFFVMRRIPNDVSFEDDVTEFHVVRDINDYSSPIPSVLKWVSFNADVVNGDEVSHHPLPPRGNFKADNARLSGDSTFYTNYYMQSPAILMDRNPQPAQVRDNGDEIRSFPIDMTGKISAVLSVSIQRTVKRDDWERGFCDRELVGCEQRVIVGGNWAATVGIGSATADEILVQYAKSSPDGVKGICWLHGSDLTWNELPQEDEGSVTWPDGHACALRLYGGGGYVVGYNDSRIGTNYNKAYPMAYNSGTREKLGLRDNVYDDGMDYEYRKFSMTIPDRFIDAPNDGAYNFRFRIKVWADDNQMLGSVPGIPDDNDPFYVDNVRILNAGSECIDVECNSVRVIWPYSVTPASQAIALPIRVKVSNNSGASAPSYWVKVRIFRINSHSQIDTAPIYCRTISQASLHAGEQTEIKFPDWNARKSPPGLYRIFANVFIPYEGGDSEPLNDTTYYDFHVVYSDCIQYDPADNTVNDVPDGNFKGINGSGLNLYGISMGGGVWATTSNDLPNYKREWEAGSESGSGSGQIAMKFKLFQADTIFGYKAFFAAMGCSWSEIVRLSIYDGVQLPSKMVEGTEVDKCRGIDDLRGGRYFWDQYVTYLLPEPKFLKAGSYWMTISQMGETGLELGASKSRVGMRTLDTYTSNPPGDSSFQNGSGSIFLLLDKNLRTADSTGDLINLNVFAYENVMGRNNWFPFMNTQGNPAYGHLEYRGRVPDATTTPTYTRGTWIPMIAPYFGARTFGTVLQYEPCPDDYVPVELISFDGQVRGKIVDLWWETASEINNYGFHVEKAVDADDDSYNWNTIGFVKGQGTTNSATNYNYTDNNVEYGRTYHYRLRQVDLDGTQSCESYSDILTLTIKSNGELVLEPNTPNPFNNSTKIVFNLPGKTNVTLEVLDIYGNLIKTLANRQLEGSNEVEWNGTDNNGFKVSSGTYIYRLVAGDEFRTGKMTLVR